MTFIEVTLALITGIVVLTALLDGLNMLAPAPMAPLLRTRTGARRTTLLMAGAPHRRERPR
ncbi:MAG: hypothetical protein AAFU79_01460 [Myxococcota bacterium]